MGAQKGFPAKVAVAATKKMGEAKDGLIEKLRPTSLSSEQEAPNPTNDSQNHQPDSKVEGEPDNKIKHNEPPFSSSEGSIAQNQPKPKLSVREASALIGSVTGGKDIKGIAAAQRAQKAIGQISGEDAGGHLCLLI